MPPEVLEVPAATRLKIQAAIKRLEKAKKRVSVRAVREIVGSKSAHVQVTLRAWRVGDLDLAHDWGDALEQRQDEGPVRDLLERIRTANTPGDTAEVCRAASELTVLGVLPDSKARVVRDLAQEQRRGIESQDKRPRPEDSQAILLISEQTITLAKAFERIVCDERRAEVLEYVLAKLKEDFELTPAGDPLGRL